MALTNDQKAYYHQTIQNLYGGVVYSSPGMITESVADVVNTILDEAMECSKAFAVTEQLLNFLYPSGTFGDLTYDLFEGAYEAITNWIKVIETNRVYEACINTAKLNYRTPLELALLGI
jgi:hypothetical protein